MSQTATDNIVQPVKKPNNQDLHAQTQDPTYRTGPMRPRRCIPHKTQATLEQSKLTHNEIALIILCMFCTKDHAGKILPPSAQPKPF